MFLIEGVPAVVLGFVVLVFVADRPKDAAGLTPEQQTWLETTVASEKHATPVSHDAGWAQAFENGKVWLFEIFWRPQAFGAVSPTDFREATVQLHASLYVSLSTRFR